jgi:GGDEF domain-containing protein
MDPSARWKPRLKTLRARLATRDTLLQVTRDANAFTEAPKVAEWLVRQANSWLPASLLGRGRARQQRPPHRDGRFRPHAQSGPLAVVGRRMGDESRRRPADRRFIEGFARQRPRASAPVIALPLNCRGQVIGVLVGLDSQVSSAAPAVAGGLLVALQALWRFPAIALDNALALQRVEALSVTDDLTLLSNSRYLNQVLRQETKRAMRSKRPLSILFLDLDGFKSVNDTHGHLYGSKALVEAGAVIRDCARETDVVARFGGDEFALILPDTGPGGAKAVAMRIRERIGLTLF